MISPFQFFRPKKQFFFALNYIMFLHIRYNDVLKYRFDFNECFFFFLEKR